MPDEKKGLTLPAKVTAFSAVLFMVSIGLCAVGGDFMSSHPGFLTSAGVLCFFVSIAGLFVGIMWLVVAAISRVGQK